MTQRTRLRYAGLFLLLLGLAFVSPLVALTLKLFVEMFAVGDSFVKVYLFLAFVVAVLLVPEREGLPDVSKPTSVLLFVLLLAAFAEHAFVMQQVGLPITGSANFVHAGNYSTTRLEHIHVPKMVLGAVFSSNHVFDDGAPYQRFFPSTLMGLQLILLVLVSLGALLVLSRVRKEQSVSDLGVSILVWFVLLKACVDGGPLNGECVAVIPLHLQQVWGKRWYHWGAVLWPCYFLGMSSAYGLQVLRAYHLLSTGFMLLAIRQVLRPNKRWWWILLLLGVVVFPAVRNQLHPALKYTNQSYNLFQLVLRRLEPGDVVYATKAGSFGDSDLAMLEGVEVSGPFQTARLRILKPVRVYGLCREFGLNIPRRPVSLFAQTPRSLETRVLKPGSSRGDFSPYSVTLPAGADINFFVAGLPEDSVFLRVQMKD